jgi:hypothetical protein
MTCPHCGEAARFVEYRPKTFLSALGEVTLERAYYHCSQCGQGHFPWDQMLRLSPQRLTPAAQELTALAGITDSFAEAAERILVKMSGLRLSESTVQRTTEASGKHLGERLQQGEVFGARTDWEWHSDAQGCTCAYVSVDATGVLMQGEKPGSQADGRMVYVGMVFNPQPRAAEDRDTLAMPCDGVRYLAGLYTLEELGQQLRRQAAQVGMEHVEQWLALTDGGSGLESFLEVNFPRAQRIIDFRHVTEHLGDFVKQYRPGPGGERLLEAWCHTLKHAGGSRVLQLVERLDVQKMPAEVAAEHEKLRTYLRNHRHKMDYPEYLRQGWQIASGAVESGCKNVINSRLCMGGMRWREFGSDSVAHLRALYRSDPEQWDAFWAVANLAA